MINYKFRKKPVVIEAFQMTEARRKDNSEWPPWLHDAWNMQRGAVGALWPTIIDTADGTVSIGTLEGPLEVSFDDWIIRGIKKEIYPCKSDVFELTYETETALQFVFNGHANTIDRLAYLTNVNAELLEERLLAGFSFEDAIKM